MKSHYLPILAVCPWCGSGPLDGATNASLIENDAPNAGDVMVCSYCAQPCELTSGGNMVRLDLKTLGPKMRETVDKAMWAARQMPAKFRERPKRGK